MDIEIEITSPVPGDEKLITAICKETWLDTYPNEEYDIKIEDILSKDFDSQKKLDSWLKIILADGQDGKYLRVAKDKGTIIGYCCASISDELHEIRSIYIRPPYQQRSIGKRLLEDCLGRIGQKKDITLKVAAFNEKAIRFYKKFGFVIVEDSFHNKPLPNGKDFPLIEMCLPKPTPES